MIERTKLTAARTHATTCPTRLFDQCHVDTMINQCPRACGTSDPSTDDRNFHLSRRTTHNARKALDIEPRRVLFERTRPNRSEYGILWLKRAIEESKAPQKPCITRRIRAIKRCSIVQVEQR